MEGAALEFENRQTTGVGSGIFQTSLTTVSIAMSATGGTADLCAYEKERNEQIAANNQRLAAIGLPAVVTMVALNPIKPSSKSTVAKRKDTVTGLPAREQPHRNGKKAVARKVQVRGYLPA